MKIKDLEIKRKENMIAFKEFYNYFKDANYNLSLKQIKEMYRIYVK